jgi:4-hydroxybenzoate polyprenyltransferase
MPVMYFVTGFSVFAFMVTFLREMVKDMEDREGDKEVGKKTMAVVFGIATSKIIAQVLLWATVFSIYYVAFKYLPGDWISLAYFTIFIVIPLLYVSWKLQKANLPNAFHLVQQILKIILVTGLLYAVLICVQLA